MTAHRRKMCEHCAFRRGSVETTIPEQRDLLVGECLHRTFFCHETMHQRNPEESKWIGSFDYTRRQDGSPAEAGDHQICAGFAIMFGSDYGIDAKDIPVENHYFCGEKSNHD